MSKSRTSLYALLLALLTLSIACVSGPPAQDNAAANANGTGANSNKSVRIGFLMDTLKEERWAKDKELFEQAAREMGASVDVLVANGSDAVQQQQAESLLTKGVDVLVVCPHNGAAASGIVEMAKRQNVPVIAYDRMIMNADVDLYASHQVPRIGEMQAQYAVDKGVRGNYLLIGGSPTDNNAVLLIQGQRRILDPLVQRGDIKIVGEQMAAEWKAEEALKHTENALTQNDDNIQAVIASNDGTAGGVVQALKGRGLTGKVLVTGQDAELAALQRIARGEQTMTIYKPIKPLAYSAVESAIKLARRQSVAPNAQINNKRKDVPSVLQDPIAVDKDNLMSTVIKDGYHSYDKVYEGVPEAQRPARGN